MRKLVFVIALSACADDGGAKAPVAPTNLVVTSVNGGAHLVWTDNSSNEDQFVIKRKTNAGYTDIDMVPFDTSQYHDAIVDAGTTYTYMITAINADGEASSNEVAFTP